MKSNDGGKSWEDPKLVFSSNDKADYPQLIENNGKVFLAINTVADGFKLLPMLEN
jgi:hypothetical protein